jgi:hypothetical protein
MGSGGRRFGGEHAGRCVGRARLQHLQLQHLQLRRLQLQHLQLRRLQLRRLQQRLAADRRDDGSPPAGSLLSSRGVLPRAEGPEGRYIFVLQRRCWSRRLPHVFFARAGWGYPGDNLRCGEEPLPPLAGSEERSAQRTDRSSGLIRVTNARSAETLGAGCEGTIERVPLRLAPVPLRVLPPLRGGKSFSDPTPSPCLLAARGIFRVRAGHPAA